MSYNLITVRLTADNIDTAFRPGDTFTDDPGFGVVRSARLTRDGYDNAKIYTDRDSDILGLPSTVRITRVTI